MRFKIIHESKAEIVLTDAEVEAVKARRVPMIYSPGGMGPSSTFENNKGVFGGSCFVDAEQKLLSCLAQFRTALTAEVERQHNIRLASEAWRAGFEAFPADRYMDAMRGVKSFPDDVRCPYRVPERVQAWTFGYNAAQAEVLS